MKRRLILLIIVVLTAFVPKATFAEEAGIYSSLGVTCLTANRVQVDKVLWKQHSCDGNDVDLTWVMKKSNVGTNRKPIVCTVIPFFSSFVKKAGYKTAGSNYELVLGFTKVRDLCKKLGQQNLCGAILSSYFSIKSVK